MNPKTLELRNLLGEGPEGVKCCSICGKPESRATKDVKALTHHKAAIDGDLPAQFRLITKYLGVAVLDFVQKDKFNAQLESIRAKLTAAREEHDAYTPPDKAKEHAGLCDTLAAMLKMVGVETLPEVDVTPTLLATRLHSELSKLMAIKAEVAAIKEPGENDTLDGCRA